MCSSGFLKTLLYKWNSHDSVNAEFTEATFRIIKSNDCVRLDLADRVYPVGKAMILLMLNLQKPLFQLEKQRLCSSGFRSQCFSNWKAMILLTLNLQSHFSSYKRNDCARLDCDRTCF